MIQCMAQELLRVYKQARANVDEQIKVCKVLNRAKKPNNNDPWAPPGAFRRVPQASLKPPHPCFKDVMTPSGRAMYHRQ